MSSPQTLVETEIDYPESDGQPMGETDHHIEWIIRLRDIFKHRYADQPVYVAADLLLYYVEGTPSRYVVPDVFVVKDCDPGPRRIYKCWDEPSPPHVVFEITSRGSKREDTVFKPRIYAEIGVREYFVYDPTQEYLNPALRGFRLQEGGAYVPIEPDADGWLWSLELDVKCRLEGNDLILADGGMGQRLLTRWQAEHEAREEERRLREASDAEVQKLQDELRRLRDQQSSAE